MPARVTAKNVGGVFFETQCSVDIGASANLELVDKFCYLGDMLSVEGDADAAVEARIRVGWNKFSGSALACVDSVECDSVYLADSKAHATLSTQALTTKSHRAALLHAALSKAPVWLSLIHI